MDWFNEALKRIYEFEHRQNRIQEQRHTVGMAWPYNGGSDEDIEKYLHQIVACLEASSVISIEADFNSYGSGYASFVDMFCFKKDGSTRQRFLGSGEKVTGIQVYLSRLAPVAVYGAEERTRHANGGSSSLLGYDAIGTVPDGDWKCVLEEVHAVLENFGLEIADAMTVSKLLPFDASIETNLGEPPFRIFDLFFYWYD